MKMYNKIILLCLIICVLLPLISPIRVNGEENNINEYNINLKMVVCMVVLKETEYRQKGRDNEEIWDL